ncbi:MAG: DUF1697 domain-containing protein [Clostridium sp.]|uniref:DUF1697 domain-containing protein n=1 Tax=Clostridium sp. TaxID=1506 RepID=UPI003F2BE9BA
MKVIALLRGVMPTGKNRIPKMTELVKILENIGFKEVRTYIQSGNILLDSELVFSEIAFKIHNEILKEIGADLDVIIKTKEELELSINENPFNADLDSSRIHLVFTNENIDKVKLKEIEKLEFDGEIFCKGNACLYMYLPRDARKKRLNNNYLEKRLGIRMTTRKLSVIKKLNGLVEK